ncbi:MAG: hypothetical protein ACRD4Z_02880 [Nitrososphaeraceae archaeon]
MCYLTRGFTNSKHAFINAEPVTPKSATPEPLTVKSVSSATVRS